MADKKDENQDVKENKKTNGPVEFEKSKKSQEAEEKFDKAVLGGQHSN